MWMLQKRRNSCPRNSCPRAKQLSRGETAVQGCNPTLSVSFVFVSHKVNFLLPVYQPYSFACILVIFWLIRVYSRSYVSLQHYRWRYSAYFTSTRQVDYFQIVNTIAIAIQNDAIGELMEIFEDLLRFSQSLL